MGRHRLSFPPEKRRPKQEGELRLGRIRKYDDWALKRFIERLNFYGLPYGVYVEGGWITSPTGRSTRLYLHVRIGVRDVRDRRTSIQLGGSYDFLRLPRGRYVQESLLLNHVRREVMGCLEHELLESFHVDGHRVFDPHTRTGRARYRR